MIADLVNIAIDAFGLAALVWSGLHWIKGDLDWFWARLICLTYGLWLVINASPSPLVWLQAACFAYLTYRHIRFCGMLARYRDCLVAELGERQGAQAFWATYRLALSEWGS